METIRITISGGKGGIGKSLVAANLAFLSAQTQKTLLVDCDTECPNDHVVLDLKLIREKNLSQPIPKFDSSKCIQCGKCARACKQEAIVFIKDKNPAFIKDLCIGCMACKISCPVQAISEKKKEIGKIYKNKINNLHLLTGELKIGELASGEIVSKVRTYADEYTQKNKIKTILIDSAAGIGCPVIASIKNTNFVIAVTEPTPAAFYDLKRLLFLADNFNLKRGLVINKSTLNLDYTKKLKKFANKNNILILGEIPYDQEIVNSMVKQKLIVEINKKYKETFQKILNEIIHNL